MPRSKFRVRLGKAPSKRIASRLRRHHPPPPLAPTTTVQGYLGHEVRPLNIPWLVPGRVTKDTCGRLHAAPRYNSFSSSSRGDGCANYLSTIVSVCVSAEGHDQKLAKLTIIIAKMIVNTIQYRLKDLLRRSFVCSFFLLLLSSTDCQEGEQGAGFWCWRNTQSHAWIKDFFSSSCDQS